MDVFSEFANYDGFATVPEYVAMCACGHDGDLMINYMLQYNQYFQPYFDHLTNTFYNV